MPADDDRISRVSRDLANFRTICVKSKDGTIEWHSALVYPSRANPTQKDIIPWLCRIGNAIRKAVSIRGQTSWRYHYNESIVAANATRSMDFSFSSPSRDLDWRNVDIVGEHSEGTENKLFQLADYALQALFHQVDRRFIFGVILQRGELTPILFTPVAVVKASPIDVRTQVPEVIRLFAGLALLSPEKLGRDHTFERQPLQNSLEYQLHLKLPARDAKPPLAARIEGFLYRCASLMGRRTQVCLAEEHGTERQLVVKIVSRDLDVRNTEAQILNYLSRQGCADTPIMLRADESYVRGVPDSAKAFILQNAFPDLETDRQRCIIVFETIGVPLKNVRPGPAQLAGIMRDGLRAFQRVHQLKILHRDISVGNVLVCVEAGDSIRLDSGGEVRMRAGTKLVGGTGHLSFLNDYDLATYDDETPSGLSAITGTYAFIAPSRLRGWGGHHAHQDVISLFFCFMWMTCFDPRKEPKPPGQTQTPISPVHSHNLRNRVQRSAPLTQSSGSSRSVIYKEDHGHPCRGWYGPDSDALKIALLSDPDQFVTEKSNLAFRGPEFRDLVVGMAKALHDDAETGWRPPLTTRFEDKLIDNDLAASAQYKRMMDQRLPALFRKLFALLDTYLDQQSGVCSRRPMLRFTSSVLATAIVFVIILAIFFATGRTSTTLGRLEA